LVNGLVSQKTVRTFGALKKKHKNTKIQNKMKVLNGGWSAQQSANWAAMALSGIADLESDHLEFGSAHPSELGIDHQLVSDIFFSMAYAEEEEQMAAEQAWEDSKADWDADYFNTEWEYPEQ